MNQARVFFIIFLLLFVGLFDGQCYVRSSRAWETASLEWKMKWDKEEKQDDWQIFLGCASLERNKREKEEEEEEQERQIFLECVREAKAAIAPKSRKQFLYRSWEEASLEWKTKWKKEEEREEWQIILGCASLEWNRREGEKPYFLKCVREAKLNRWLEKAEEYLRCLKDISSCASED